MAKFKFIDLFAGIGGFHLAMHALGGECVFASEVDAPARKTYTHNFQKISPHLFENDLFNSDIRTVLPEDIPDFDMLCAGFPCQPFSQAGHKRGFNDSHKSERGNLFFNIVDILAAKKPQAFFLENVRGIVNHDKGKTFRVIREILEEELGYSFYFKIVKASDYGLPQLRPRAFMIGFRDEGCLKSFHFPESQPLKFTMSDVWKGECSREIGFTLRVGGRGSPIDDRRNWDSYLVDNKVKRLSHHEAKKMQGFPDEFEFPVAATQAMKQLGNSVAVDAVQVCGDALITHMLSLQTREKSMKKTKNKGEWTEFLIFIILLKDRKLSLADKDLNPTSNFLTVSKVTTHNLDYECDISQADTIRISSKTSTEEKTVKTADVVDSTLINNLVDKIKAEKGTFTIDAFQQIENTLGFTFIKGGTSSQKADIVLDISTDQFFKQQEGFGIKSYLGSKPTLLNASGNTNFIYRVTGIDPDCIDEVNNIDSSSKLKSRVAKIQALGGQLTFEKTEKETLNYNLKLVDSFMPVIVAYMLHQFHVNRSATIEENLIAVHQAGDLNKEIGYGELDVLIIKVKKLLVNILLGFFPGKKWDGYYNANGMIVMKGNGQQVGFSLLDQRALENYLFEHIRFDTPSMTRHRYGSLIRENDNSLYFKLNLQLRFL